MRVGRESAGVSRPHFAPDPDVDPDHRLPATDRTVHHDWDADRDPVLAVAPGDVVEVDCLDATGGRLGPDATVADLDDLSVPGHALTGPVAVEGLAAGETLAVDLLGFDHEGWGVTWFYPGADGTGLVPEELDEPGLHVWDLDGDVGRFVDGIEVPLDPFPGNLGVPPAANGPHSTTPPRRVGGNLDVKHLTKGSTLYLPVDVDGGLFSLGDCHGAQGDGEVCVTGVEAPMTVTLRLRRADRDVDAPAFETGGPFAPGRADRAYATAGVADDLERAAAEAVSSMLDHLEGEGLSRSEAYMLCSTAVDLKVNEVVNAPNWVVSAYLPAL
jgi:acetamidase/formamidase